LHNVPGFYSLFILLIIALTGLVFSFDWFDHGVQWIANGGIKPVKQKALFSDTTQMNSMLPMDKIYHDLAALNPDALLLSISLPEKKKGIINASARHGIHTRYNVIRYEFDQYTGELLKTSTFDEKNKGEKLRAMNYNIHTGAILGLPGKFLAFFASLISASLPVTGFMIWYGRRNKKTVQNKPTVIKSTPNKPRLKRSSLVIPSIDKETMRQ